MAYEEEAAIKQLFSSTVQVDQECMDRCNILYHLALCYHTLNPILQHEVMAPKIKLPSVRAL